MLLTLKTVDVTIDLHQRISEAYCALIEQIGRLCSKIDALNQIDVQRNGHGITIRAADRGTTAILGCSVPLNRPNGRRIRMLVREGAQTQRSHFAGSAGA